MLEKIAPLLPILLIGLIAILAIALLIEVHKQIQPNLYKRSNRRKRQPLDLRSTATIIIFAPALAQLLITYMGMPSGVAYLIAMFIIGLLWGQSDQPTSPAQQRMPHSPYRAPFQNDSADVKALKRKLLNLVNGDHRGAQRLLNQCQRDHPGMDAEWYLDKVIYDIIRDRH